MPRRVVLILVILALAPAAASCRGGRFDALFRASQPSPGTEGRVEGRPPSTPAPCDEARGCHGAPTRTGAFAGMAEASGLAASGRDPDLLWLIDDQPGDRELWAVRADGRLVARVPVEGLDAVNVESLAGGPCGPGDPDPCLYIGDVGDNRRARADIRVLRVREPDLSAFGTARPTQAPGAATRPRTGTAGPASPPSIAPPRADEIRLRYPGGPQDAEALLVDGDGVPYVVTKATFDAATGVTGPTRLYAAPGFRGGPLLELGEVRLPPPETAVASLLYGNVVTGGDAGPGRVLLRTYDHAVEFTAPEPEAALAGFPAWPARVVPAPWQPQAEAIAYAHGGCAYYLVSERSGDIWFVPCRP